MRSQSRDWGKAAVRLSRVSQILTRIRVDCVCAADDSYISSVQGNPFSVPLPPTHSYGVREQSQQLLRVANLTCTQLKTASSKDSVWALVMLLANEFPPLKRHRQV